MRIALQTGTISPHQLPLAREIVKRVGAENYRYVYSQEIDRERKSFGWSDAADEPWCISAGTPEAREWVETCDVLVTSFRDCDLIERRAKNGLKTWYCNERWFKPVEIQAKAKGEGKRWNLLPSVLLPGRVRMLVPGFRRMAKRFVELVNGYEGVGILAIGPWAKRDFLRLGVREEKIVDWGYFVQTGDVRAGWSKETSEGNRTWTVEFSNKEELTGVPTTGEAATVEVTRLKPPSTHTILKRIYGVNGAVRTPHSLRILWAGRDIPLKRVKDIERAVALANAKMKDEGRKRSERANSGIFNSSTFQPFNFTKLTGVKADVVRKAMREHDVFVFASTAQEGWGAVVNEALEEGMRVIGTFEAGASAAMLPKERLYHAGDVKALATLLEKEFRGELPLCSIGEWSAEKGAERLLKS